MSARDSIQMAQRVASPPIFNDKQSILRPISQASDHVYTEFEDDESDVEGDSLRSSNQSLDNRRRSDTTVSSYNDVETPETDHGQFEILIKPVQGPQGPHLFRSSQASAEFVLDFALQMSPMDARTPPPRPNTAASYTTAQTQRMSRRSLPPVFVNIPGLPANIHDWTSNDVIDWLFNIGSEMVVIDSFRQNDISGTVLHDMKFEDLKDLGISSFGKRHELWSNMGALKGGQSGPSPVPTPFQDLQLHSPEDIDDFEFPRSACSSTSMEDLTPIDDAVPKKKRSRKHRRHHRTQQSADQIDLGRMSFLAIEEKLPEEHVCEKGHECSKWKRWNRRVQKARDFNQTLRISESEGCGVTYTTSQSSSKTMAPCEQACLKPRTTEVRPMSEGVPSVVASSDVFGPSQMPDFALHEEQLQQLARRDPQENVKNFLHLQHISSPMEAPPPAGLTPVEPTEAAHPVAAFEEAVYHTERFDMFPSTYYHPPCAPVQLPAHTPAPHEQLRHLPKLAIPRSATASPSLTRRHASVRSPVSALTPTYSATMSPSRSNVISPVTLPRASTPASEMDVPMTAPPMAPYQRDFSQSVPPNMLYREQSSLSRSCSRADWRRPSFAMPSLLEGNETPLTAQPLSAHPLSAHPLSAHPLSAHPPSRRPTVRRASDESSEISAHLAKTQDMYGLACTQAGWMKKRRTRLLRHEWQESHFRLTGTQLEMHDSDRQTAKVKDTIDVERYTVNCATGASNGKLAAALKSLKIKNEEKQRDAGAFAFQLVPEVERGWGMGGKTHHFAVGGREERIDWMRDLMLAKAKGQRGRGFDVQINGV